MNQPTSLPFGQPIQGMAPGRVLPELPRPLPAKSEDFRAALDLFSDAFDQLTDAVCVLDAQLNVRHWNAAAVELSGLGARSVVGKRWTGHMVQNTNVSVDHGERRKSLIGLCLETGQPVSERGYLRRTDGRWIPIQSRAVPLRDTQNKIIGIVGVFRDVSRELSLQSENESLRRQSLMDGLTQVANRAAFDELIKQQIQARRENGQLCSLIMADLDHFKSINDSFGHTAGDSVLKVFANVMKQFCRPEDVVARYGGEEFGIILPNCDVNTAVERAEVIRNQLASVVVSEIPDRQITASFGVAELEDGDTESSFVGRADEALYQSKHKGRNRTDVARGLSTSEIRPSASRLEHVCSWLVTPSGEMIAMKLRGFLKELKGEMLDVSESRIRVKVGKGKLFRSFHPVNNPLPVELEITFGRTHITSQTHIRIVVTSVYNRVSREDFDARVKQVLKVLRSYLMADDADYGDE